MKKILTLWLLFILHTGVMTAVYAEDVHYDRLINKAAFIHLDEPSVHLIQLHLADIYQHDPNWGRDVNLSQQPLTDSLIGPVTLFWLQRFVGDFKIPPVGSFTSEVMIRLARIATFSSFFPQEMKVLLSVDFAIWNEAQPALQRDNFYTIRRSGTDQVLLELVHRYLQTAVPLTDTEKRQAELTTYFYQLNADDFKQLQSKEQILLLLGKLENKYYDNFPDFKVAIEKALKDYSVYAQKILPLIKQYVTKDGITMDTVILDRVNRQLQSDPLLTALNGVFATFLENELGGIAYPNKRLFDKAVKAKLTEGIGACVINEAHNPYISGLRISDSNFKQLTDELLQRRNDELLNLRQDLIRIEELRSGDEKCSSGDREFVDELVDDIYTVIIQPAVILLYKKTPVFDKSLPIQWSGAGCGCLLDELSGMVYGFYPFWLADGEVQAVNFSTLSRVAYYGLSFDEQGIIKQTNDSSHSPFVSSDGMIVDSFQSEFVQVARKHNTKIDWVIHNDKRYWDVWQTRPLEARVESLETLTNNIVGLLTSPLADTYTTINDVLTLGMVSRPTQGDGVTLYFSDYPDDLESLHLFNNFFTKLKQRLDAAGSDYFVNIMVQQVALGEGIYNYENLLQRISEFSQQELAADRHLQSKILVLIEEPTTDTKKKLRLAVESGELHGLQRGLLLKNIIPVIQFEGKNWMQLEDDLVYFKENFGGVGFWPLVTNESFGNTDMALQNGSFVTVTGYLTKYFQNVERDGQPNSWLNNFTCEHRDIIRLLLFVFVVISLILIWSYRASCRLCKIINKHSIRYFFVIAVPVLLLTGLLLIYDPLLSVLSKGNLTLIIIITVALVASIVIIQRRKLQGKKPVRPRFL